MADAGNGACVPFRSSRSGAFIAWKVRFLGKFEVGTPREATRFEQNGVRFPVPRSPCFFLSRGVELHLGDDHADPE